MATQAAQQLNNSTAITPVNVALDDNFENAFAQLAKLGEGDAPPADFGKKKDEADATTQQHDKAGEAAAAAGGAAEDGVLPASATIADDEGDAAGGEGGKGPAAQEAEADARRAPGLSEDDLLQRFAKIVRETPPQQTQQQQPQQQQPEPPPLYSPDEQAFLAEYDKEWPDVAKAESIRRRGEYRYLTQYIFGQVAQQLAPLLEIVNTMASKTHVQDLHGAVENYDDLRDKVIEWALDEKQPLYLRSAYAHVIQNGSVDDIKDLIGRYQAATGGASGGGQPTQQTTTQQPPAKASGSELPTAAKQAAASLAPVGSKRSAVVTPIQSASFEDAFSQFAKET